MVLPSAPPSETSPSKPIPRKEPERLSAPEWRNEDEAVKWFLQMRDCLKSIIYRLMSNIQYARRIFERCNATHYSSYRTLDRVLAECWRTWKAFVSENEMTIGILSWASGLFSEIPQFTTYMSTPKGASKECARQMGSLRESSRSALLELQIVWARVTEAVVRLEESREGSQVDEHDELPQLPEISDSPDPASLVDEATVEPSEEFREHAEENRKSVV